MPDPRFKILTSASTSGPGDAGRTGSWRVERPVIDMSRCIPAKTGKHACHLCWLYCPDNVVSKGPRTHDRSGILQRLWDLCPGVPGTGNRDDSGRRLYKRSRP